MLKDMELNEIFYSLGKSDATILRNRAKDMTDTEIIDQEIKIPKFKNIDYTNHPVGTPVKSEGQVWKLLQPYDATVHTELPSNARDRWSLCHTKNPKRAKPWVDALGISGMYMKDECYLDDDGKVYIAINDNTVYKAKDYPQGWIEYKEV